MIIALTSSKGGVGKSVVATNLAVGLALRGRSVMLVDADPQASAAAWSAERQLEHSTGAVVSLAQRVGDIEPALRDYARHYSVVIADCAGRDSKEMRTALLAADVALIPLRPAQVDLNTLLAVHKRIVEATKINRKLMARILMSMVPTNPVVKDGDQAREIIAAQFPDLQVLASGIGDRKAFRDAMADGIGVLELTMSKNKAADEILDLLEEIGLGTQTTRSTSIAAGASAGPRDEPRSVPSHT